MKLRKCAEQFRTGGRGCGDFKKQLFEKLWDYFAPMRKRRDEILRDKNYINDVLERGAERCNAIAHEVMKARAPGGRPVAAGLSEKKSSWARAESNGFSSG